VSASVKDDVDARKDELCVATLALTSMLAYGMQQLMHSPALVAREEPSIE